jgi:hypothetical protein
VVGEIVYSIDAIEEIVRAVISLFVSLVGGSFLV